VNAFDPHGFDKRHVRRAFSRSAGGYDAAAALQHAVEANLLESLDYLDDPKLARPPPAMVLDLGAGPGRASAAMRRKWPKARVVAVDLAMPMLREAGKRSGWFRPFDRVCADVPDRAQVVVLRGHRASILERLELSGGKSAHRSPPIVGRSGQTTA